jgi:hypothetical protein
MRGSFFGEGRLRGAFPNRDVLGKGFLHTPAERSAGLPETSDAGPQDTDRASPSGFKTHQIG